MAQRRVVACSRLYALQGALAQQEWRVPELLNKLLHYVKPHLAHNYKTVRDRLGSVLVNLLTTDVSLTQFAGTRGPKQAELLLQIIPQLDILQESTNNHVNHKNGGGGAQQSTSTDGEPVAITVPPVSDSATETYASKETNIDAAADSFSKENAEREKAVKLCKTGASACVTACKLSIWLASCIMATFPVVCVHIAVLISLCEFLQ